MDDLTKKLVGSVQLTENDVISHSADIFRPISQEVSMVDGKTCLIKPTNFTAAGPYEFDINPRGRQYINLSKSRLHLKLRITKADGTDVVVADNVAPINLIGSSLFKQVCIEANGAKIPELTNTFYNYKTYLETILSYGHSATSSHLKASRFHTDTASKFDTCGTDNKGFESRKELGATFDVMAPLHVDFLQCDRYLPSMKFKLILYREEDAFCLMTDKNERYKLVIEEMKLYLRYINVSDHIFASHQRDFQTKRMILPINKTEVKTQVFTTGLTSLSISSFFNGVLPKSIIIGLIDNDRIIGNYKNNPYNFTNHNITQVYLSVNNEYVPSDPYTPDYANNFYIREFRDLFDNLGILHDDVGNAITPEYYKNNMNFYAFDLSPDLCNGFHFHPHQTGSIDVEVKMSTALTKPVTLMAFATYNMIVSIDKDEKWHVGV